jgi:hypothetical protein
VQGNISAHDLSRFFDRFCEEFATFDGARVAQLFVTPCIALREDGELRGFREQQDVASYYQAALARYRDSGCAACKWSDLHVQRIRQGSVIATVTWDLLQTDISIRRWRQANFIASFGGKLRIYGSAFAEN